LQINAGDKPAGRDNARLTRQLCEGVAIESGVKIFTLVKHNNLNVDY